MPINKITNFDLSPGNVGKINEDNFGNSIVNLGKGRYGAVWVEEVTRRDAHLSVDGTMNADELRRAAILFQFIANCMDEENER